MISDTVLLAKVLPLSVKDPVISADRDAASPPLGSATAAASVTAFLPVIAWSTLLIALVAVNGVSGCKTAKDASEEPAAAQIVGVHNTSATELDTLACVVHPSKIDVQGGLNDAKDDGDGIRAGVLLVKGANEPVEAVQGAVGAKGEEIEGIDDSGDGRLAEKEELRQDAN